MNSLKELYQKVKIDWTDFLIECDDCQDDSIVEFELSPEDFLKFAKNSIKSKDIQNVIEGISNAKRAIDCQVDLLIKTIGYDYRIFDKRTSYPEAKKFINDYYLEEEQYDGLTDRLKLINILGLAPIMIISNIRKIRNIIEHEYKIPTFNDAKSAAEVADLFINSSNSKFCFAPTIVNIGNKAEINGTKNCSIKVPYIKLFFSNYRSTNTIQIYFVESNKKVYDFDEFPHLDLKSEDKNYIEILYCILNKGYNVLPCIFGCDISPEHMGYEVLE